MASLRAVVETLVIAVLLATFVRTYVFQALQIPTASMEESLLVGDHILVNKFVFSPWMWPLELQLLPLGPLRRGDVVVLRSPEAPDQDVIKRCVGLSGDVVEIVDDELYVNGEPTSDAGSRHLRAPSAQPPVSPSLAGATKGARFGPVRVPPGHFFALGDNRSDSRDSRFWGPVRTTSVRGRALIVYWSFERAAREGGGRRQPRELAAGIRRFFTHARWERIFSLIE